MGAVDFDRVEAQVFGVRRRLGEGRDRVGDILLAHGTAARFLRGKQAGRTFDRSRRRPARHALGRGRMPDLRPHAPARGVDRVDDALPAAQRGLAVEEGDMLFVARRRPVDDRTLRQDKPDLALGAAAVIVDIGLARHAVGRLIARHRRHDDAVFKLQRPQFERLEKDLVRHGFTPLRLRPNRYIL